jgi:thioredoxin reductase/polyferredoxin
VLKIRQALARILASGSPSDHRRPAIGKHNESNVKGLYVIGDLAGAPVIKLAMAQGLEVVEHIAGLPDMAKRDDDPELLDVLIVGAGAAGLNAALAAKDLGLRHVVLEKEVIANTIENFPEGKWVYSEPDDVPAKGKLWLDGARKEDLIKRWRQIVAESELDVRAEEPLEHLERQRDGTFVATSSERTYRTRKVILATGQRGNPRKLGVPGEELEQVYHRLYSPRKYRNESIIVVGGGNSAIEAALTLSEQNTVSERNAVLLAYRGSEFARVFKDNRAQLDQAVREGRVEISLNTQVSRFEHGTAHLTIDRGGHQEERAQSFDHAFVLIGAELPVGFLRKLGIELENDWPGGPLWSMLLTAATFGGLWLLGAARGGVAPWGAPPWEGLGDTLPWAGALVALLAGGGLIVRGLKARDRWSWLGLSFFIWYSVYGIKVGSGEEFWPYRGWGYTTLSFAGRSWAFWYTVVYTGLMTGFGLQALKRWGLDRRDRFQILRYTSLISFQWLFFFLIPEFLFQWAVKYQWVGETLATNPQFADQAWRSYGLIYAWPLFFYTWLYDPHQIWVVWGVVLTFGLIPILVLFHGKRYCSWICGCGGLAETFGDRWRHLAPKGKLSIKLEQMGVFVLVLAGVITVILLGRDTWGLMKTADWGIYGYRVIVDIWLVGILPVTVYPFMGGKVWCRFWCPLAKMMQIQSKIFARLGWSRFHIVANDKCIGCNECSRNCQVGIDVMQYALKQEVLDNETTSCIGCGVCVTVCPMDTLSFGPKPGKKNLLPIVQ